MEICGISYSVYKAPLHNDLQLIHVPPPLSMHHDHCEQIGGLGTDTF